MRSQKKMRDDFRQMCVEAGTYSAKLEPTIETAARLQYLLEQMDHELHKRSLMIETIGSTGQPIIKQHPHIDMLQKVSGKILAAFKIMGLCHDEAPEGEQIDTMQQFFNSLDL